MLKERAMLKTILVRAAFAFAIGSTILSLPAPAHAEMTAADARAAGLIGEKPDGLVGAVKPEGQALADHINAERKRVYQDIANGGSQTLDQVMAVAGAKQISKLKPGEYYWSGGGWAQK